MRAFYQEHGRGERPILKVHLRVAVTCEIDTGEEALPNDGELKTVLHPDPPASEADPADTGVPRTLPYEMDPDSQVPETLDYD